jgi:hypothetical protein
VLTRLGKQDAVKRSPATQAGTDVLRWLRHTRRMLDRVGLVEARRPGRDRSAKMCGPRAPCASRWATRPMTVSDQAARRNGSYAGTNAGEGANLRLFGGLCVPFGAIGLVARLHEIDVCLKSIRDAC